MTEICVEDPIIESKYLTSKDNSDVGVKEEHEVTIKIEAVECVVCLVRISEQNNISCTKTEAGTLLHDYLIKFSQTQLFTSTISPKYICKICLDLVNVLEHAELEYIKVKEAFDSIISKNPLFAAQPTVSIESSVVKNEVEIDTNNDSEDEPLALTKKKRNSKLDKRKRKPVAPSKRKVNNKENDLERWECTECEVSGQEGGQEALTAHILLTHSITSTTVTGNVKKEESPDRSQSPPNVMDDSFTVEADGFGDDDDDDSSNYMPDEVSNGKRTKRKIVLVNKKKSKSEPKKKRNPKTILQCDQCDAKYTSLVRFEHHKQKHDDSKPPYICEVCGAHYKHKRACDIHVALHKGISDWKCEECNRLFPSKGALQRHNNIHTGKLNYQCDLCGKSFIHTSSFKMHKLAHSGLKPHSCDVCGLALMTSSHLKRHKRVHSGEKRHECTICGKRFSERYNLIAHSRAHAAPAPVAAAPRRRFFRCAFCPERFERRYQLERHCAAAHGRALERPPPTPRNTMSKLLKAQAARRQDDDLKNSRSPDTKSPPLSQKVGSQSSSPMGEAAPAAWAGAYALEFGIRTDFPH